MYEENAKVKENEFENKSREMAEVILSMPLDFQNDAIKTIILIVRENREKTIEVKTKETEYLKQLYSQINFDF